ncbi:MAG TPA: gamma-glutamyl-gamma-aminobutyrate hydrolase family protein [Solirubrobacteraceae bacterium]|nr:gamma-glutamyl-gamma-aminobutyrate hydrolase family protein [Solirubrobacteraceae bacterium]
MIAALGDRNPAYVTHREIDATIALAPQIRWVGTEDARIDGYDGVWVVPGTPYRDEAAVLEAIRFARESGMPILGTCGGFQHMAVEYARSVLGIAGAAHAESDPEAETIVVGALACSLVGEVRTVSPVPDTRLAAICGSDPFPGFHFCSYGLAADLPGVVVSAYADDAGVEAFELPDHPFYLATLFQPQVGTSERGWLHPVLAALLAAVSDAAASRPV